MSTLDELAPMGILPPGPLASRRASGLKLQHEVLVEDLVSERCEADSGSSSGQGRLLASDVSAAAAPMVVDDYDPTLHGPLLDLFNASVAMCSESLAFVCPDGAAAAAHEDDTGTIGKVTRAAIQQIHLFQTRVVSFDSSTSPVASLLDTGQTPEGRGGFPLQLLGGEDFEVVEDAPDNDVSEELLTDSHFRYEEGTTHQRTPPYTAQSTHTHILLNIILAHTRG